MFDRFTDRARKSCGVARMASLRWNHDYIGTEHLLLGLLGAAPNTATAILDLLSVDRAALTKEIENRLVAGKTLVTMGQLPFTPRGKQALEVALEFASANGDTYVGTEHLLLGVARVDGVAAESLRAVGFDEPHAIERLVEARKASVASLPRDERAQRRELARRANLHGASVLLSFLQSGDVAVREALKASGANVDRLREELLRRIHEPPPGPPPPAPPNP